MGKTDHVCRVYLVGNPDKPDAARALEELRSLSSPGCQVVGASLSRDAHGAVEAHADRVIVIGGDGTLIGIARSLGADQIPLVGVNVGKLGFLAEFSLEDLKSSLDRALHDEALVSRRTVLQVTVHRNGGGTDVSLAINDCVIQAGPPFRVINLAIAIDGEHLTNVAGDGLIVCTPSGSTAHNLSAGGPILQPEIGAIVLTPLSPHSLTHKPLVVERESTIEIRAVAVNDGTTVIIDGQVSYPLGPGDRVSVERFGTDFLIVRNPLHAKWHNLVTKLHWGRSPSYE
ncbi:MAG: NAD(+)/NADH kinase [Planctomycetes bacterium]|nr:NAD(+)/NADH kinase [Planctomycetota bacterium]